MIALQIALSPQFAKSQQATLASQFQSNAQGRAFQDNSAQTQATTPHPAVVRVIARHGVVTSYGSGTLVAKKPGYGFIITNWHVVCDTNGSIKVKFPDKREYDAAVIAVDDRWDLALVVIAEPTGVNPIVISKTIPEKDDNYWVAGYRGDGTYRINGGKCLSFQLPDPDSAEPELIEIGVPSENGDSGGPVFNSRYELAGVLFGSDSVTTLASHCGRVIKFLEQAAPQVANLPASPDSVIKAASLSRASILEQGKKHLGNAPTHETISVIMQPNTVQSSVSSASSFGGGLRARGNAQTPQVQNITQRRRHGFINLQYDVATHTAARSTTESGFQPGSGTGSLTNTNSVPPSGYALTEMTAGTTPSATTGHSGGYSLSGTASRTTAGTTYGSNTVYETIPSPPAYSPNRNATSTAASPIASTSQTTQPSHVAGTRTTYQTGSQTAAASPAYGGNTNSYDATRSDTASRSQSTQIQMQTPVGRNDAPTFQRRDSTTPGGVRDNSAAPTGRYDYEDRNVSPSVYNTYGSNATGLTPPPSYAGGDSRSLFDDDAMHSQYALDSTDMQADDYTPKYGDEYEIDFAGAYGIDADGSPATTGSTKSDAVKIVIAILVIFFILFHTVKTMAIAEERA